MRTACLAHFRRGGGERSIAVTRVVDSARGIGYAAEKTGKMTMAMAWKLIRVGLWGASVAFVLSALAGVAEDYLGWSDDPRWTAYMIGAGLTGVGLVAAVVMRIVAYFAKAPSDFPTVPLIVAIVVGFAVLFFLVITHLGPMGVV